MKFFLIFILPLFFNACFNSNIDPGGMRYPAEEFSKAVEDGDFNSYSFTRHASKETDGNIKANGKLKSQIQDDGFSLEEFKNSARFEGDERFLKQGLELKRSFAAPKTLPDTDSFDKGDRNKSARGQLADSISSPSPSSNAMLSKVSHRSMPPPGSRSPYLNGRSTANPSLWMNSSQNVFTFVDHRAFNPMDIVTIDINDQTLGRKRANTQTRSQFDILAGISNFFGFETSVWAANNESLDPQALIQANTEKEFRGEGDMQRQAQLRAQISAVVLEILPNGVLRIEGSKIVAINAEEEIMVISGLLRQRDISSDNRVDSNRIANMRVDFYGHGTLSDAQGPGWGASLFNKIWPF